MRGERTPRRFVNWHADDIIVKFANYIITDSTKHADTATGKVHDLP